MTVEGMKVGDIGRERERERARAQKRERLSEKEQVCSMSLVAQTQDDAVAKRWEYGS